ncbi:MAG: hypothetical protein KAS66_05280 [Candidatus Omnitrophica bacterium]|nr:hypothetical protein [Candidatus Omnitrophota bacterium]
MSILPLNHIVLNVTETDVSTAGSVWVVCPSDGKIVSISSVTDGVLATAPAVITVELGGTAVTGATLSITHTSSAAGDVYTAVPTALNHVTENQAIEIITSGASTNTVSATYSVVVELTTN